VAGHHTELPAAEGARRHDVVLLADRQGEAPRQPEEVRCERHADREDLVDQRAAQCGHDDQRQQQGGKRHQHVRAAHDQHLYAAATDSGDDAERHAEDEREQDRGQADLEGDARTPDDAAQDVAPELVGAQQMTLDRARPLEHRIRELRRRAQRRDEGRGRRDHDHDHGHGEPDADGEPTPETSAAG
jgi:hypothetical protein